VVKGGKLSYKITLQDSGERSIENDLLLEGESYHPGKLQNYVFNLYSRSIISENSRTLSRDTVCNIGNKTQKLYMSTFIVGGEREEDDSEDEEVLSEE